MTPRDEAEVVRVLRRPRAPVPVTARGGGTGNYGQAMPLKGGSCSTSRSSTSHGDRSTGGCGSRPAAAQRCGMASPRTAGQELRFHPSTHKTGTIGGYVAGGSSGIGSITWGLLRDRGNILGLRVVTMEAEPRILELRGDDIQKVNHAYGTNAVITELRCRWRPAYPLGRVDPGLRRSSWRPSASPMPCAREDGS